MELVAEGACAVDSDVKAQLIDLSEQSVAIADGRPLSEYGDDTATVVQAMTQADCMILASPIYRGSYTGALKNLLDHAPLQALEGKAVGLLATGGSEHHYLAVDFQMRGVLAWFNAYLVPGSVYLSHAESASAVDVRTLAGNRLRELGEATVALSRHLPRGVPRPHCLARIAVDRKPV